MFESDSESQFLDKVVHISRVAKVVKGGRRFSFNALVVVGDGKGQVGAGLGRPMRFRRPSARLWIVPKKALIKIPIINFTIPYTVLGTFGSGKVLLKPASEGTGVIAGGPVRAVVEVAGIQNILDQMFGVQQSPQCRQSHLCRPETIGQSGRYCAKKKPRSRGNQGLICPGKRRLW